MKFHKKLLLSWFSLVLLSTSCSTPKNEGTTELLNHIQPIAVAGDLDFSNGQVIYVPAYSQIHSVFPSAEKSRINFTVTLSIRNTDIDYPIIIKSVSYYGDDGTLLKEYVEAPFQLSKMASVSYNISQSDIRGGIGANFIVEWGANQSVIEPYIQAIMLGAQGNLGFSWRNPGYVIKEIND